MPAKVTVKKSKATNTHTATEGNEYDLTALNNETTDSVAQTDTEVASVASAVAAGSLLQSNAEALGLAALNAAGAQQQNTLNTQASAAVGVNALYSIDTSTGTSGTSGIFDQAPKHKRIARVKFMKK
jgi:hypothetical protein